MTDPYDPHDPLDDLASASLDGELSAEERARGAIDEVVRKRADRLAIARAAMQAATDVVDPERRDQAVAATVAAFNREGALGVAASGGGATPIESAPVPRRRGRRAAQLTGIAAAAALLALLVPFLGSLDSGSDNVDVASPVDSADATLRADASTADGAPESMAIAPANAMEDLGPFGDVADLATAVRDRLDDHAADEPASAGGASSGAGAGTTDSEPCAAERSEVGPGAFVALAELDGRPVLVLVRDEDDGGRTLLALDRGSCAVVATQEL